KATPPDGRVAFQSGLGFQYTPVVEGRSAGNFIGPADLTVGESHIFQMGEVGLGRILRVRHVSLDVDNNGILQLHREVVLLSAGSRGAVPLDVALGQTLTTGQRLIQQWGALIKHLSDHDWLVHSLPGRLTALRVTGQHNIVLERFNQDFIFMTFLEDVPNRRLSEVALRNEPLFLTTNRHISGCWHTNSIPFNY